MRSRLAILAVLAVSPVAVLAQGTAHDGLKIGNPVVASRPGCAPVPAGRTPTDAQRRQARDLVQRGQQAALLGDSALAREQLRQAAALDPADPDLA